ncbi:MAG: hypothetical protein QOH91_2213 [Mycobacterium sp.]|jgi:hypothetical protein|nr:hypothetical protein [Mycobacterium sp.]
MVIQQSRPSARTWLLAAAELTVALIAARLILWTDHPPTACHHHHHHHPQGTAGIPKAAAPLIHWGWVEYISLGVAVAALGWWLQLMVATRFARLRRACDRHYRRAASAAVTSAAAFAIFAASPAVRSLACQSHLVAMVVLELLLVACPLLLLRARPRPSVVRPTRRVGWTIFACVAAVLYAALLIVIHLPAVHRRGAESGSAPLWLVLVALAIGVVYWFGVLCTPDRLTTRARRLMLVGTQEVAAFIGLLSLFGTAWDQRLGGLFMIATCAAVAVPLAQNMRQFQHDKERRRHRSGPRRVGRRALAAGDGL